MTKRALFLVLVPALGCEPVEPEPVPQRPLPAAEPTVVQAPPTPLYYTVKDEESRVVEPVVVGNLVTIQSSVACEEGDVVTGGGCDAWIDDASKGRGFFPLVTALPSGNGYFCVYQRTEDISYVVQATAVCLDVDRSRATDDENQNE